MKRTDFDKRTLRKEFGRAAIAKSNTIGFSWLRSDEGEIAGLDALIFGVSLFLISSSLVLSVLKLIDTKQKLQELSDMVAREMVLSPSSAPSGIQATALASSYEPLLGLAKSQVSINTSGTLSPCSAISVKAVESSGLNIIVWPVRIGLQVPLTATSVQPTDGYHYAVAGEKGCAAP